MEYELIDSVSSCMLVHLQKGNLSEFVLVPKKNQWLIFFFAPQKDFLTAWWFGTCVIFQNIWDVILPIDELIFFKMVIAPPTSFIWHKTRPSHGIPPFLDTTFVCRRDFQRSDADPRGEIFR